MNRDDAIAAALDAVAHHDAETNREFHARTRQHPASEVRRQCADEAAHHLKTRRRCVTAALQRLLGDDLTDVECADLANELTGSCQPYRSP